MVTSGSNHGEPLASKTFDQTRTDGILYAKLLFGDGQALGLVTGLAGQVLIIFMHISGDSVTGEPDIMIIMQTVIEITTTFEEYLRQHWRAPNGRTGCASE